MSDVRIQLSKEEANLADLKQGLREIQRQQDSEEAFMKFIVKQANRVNQEEVNLNKNTSLILIGHKKTRNAAATNEDQSFKSGKDVAHSIKSDSFGRIPTEANKKSRQHITSPTKVAIDSSESYKNLNNDSRTVSESILTTPVSVNDHMMNFSGWRNTKPK